MDFSIEFNRCLEFNGKSQLNLTSPLNSREFNRSVKYNTRLNLREPTTVSGKEVKVGGGIDLKGAGLTENTHIYQIVDFFRATPPKLHNSNLYL